MKTVKLGLLGIFLLLACSSQAQLSVHLNFGVPPQWGPAGYEEARYYYLPDVEAYYDIQSSMFIYYQNRTWVHRGYLPIQYRNYDLYNGYKVVMSGYKGNTPYSNFNEYKRLYARGNNRQFQKTIGEKHDRNIISKRNYREHNSIKRGEPIRMNKNHDEHGRDHSESKKKDNKH